MGESTLSSYKASIWRIRTGQLLMSSGYGEQFLLRAIAVEQASSKLLLKSEGVNYTLLPVVKDDKVLTLPL